MASKDDIVRMMGLASPETMPEAALDDNGVRGVDIAPSDDTLEAGIAAVFDEIRNGSGGTDDTEADSETPDTGVTFALLTELNRLWERPPA